MVRNETTGKQGLCGDVSVQHLALQGIIDSIGGAIFSLDSSYRYTSFNSGHAAIMKMIYGASIEVGKSLFDYMSVKDDAATARVNIDKCLAGETIVEQAFSGEERLSRRCFEISHFPVRDKAGGVVGVAVMSSDITDQKQAETVLKETTDRLELSLSASNVGVWDLDLVSDMAWASRQHYRIFGLESEPAQWGFNVFISYVHHEDREMVKAALEKALETGVLDYHCRITTSTGIERWIIVNGRVTRNKEGTPVRMMGTVRDDTERMTARLESEKIRDQLAHEQRLAALGQLSAGVAHDFNNILGVIKGFSELILDDAGDLPGVPELVGKISTATERGANLTRQLLAFGRKQQIKPVCLDMNEHVRESFKMLGRLLREDIIIDLQLRADCSSVFIDKGQLDQILMNFASNSRDAMPSGGTLTIGSMQKKIGKDELVLGRRIDPGDYVVLLVRDNGTGIPEENLAKIFEPFFTTKRLGKGTGLGLSTILGIVQQNNGFLFVESTKGVGTCFHVYFPLHTGKELDVVDEPVETGQIVPKKVTETVLVVDDNLELLELVEIFLGKTGYKVFTASNGDEAIGVIEKEPGIDLLLTDVVMPHMGGRMLVEYIRKNRPGMKVLLMSGQVKDAELMVEIEQMKIDFIPKPFSANDLRTIVRALLDKKP